LQHQHCNNALADWLFHLLYSLLRRVNDTPSRETLDLPSTVRCDVYRMTTATSTVEMIMDDQDLRSGRAGDSSTARQLEIVHPAVLLLPQPLESEFWQSTSAIRYAQQLKRGDGEGLVLTS
jgi:hypothetical protein